MTTFFVTRHPGASAWAAQQDLAVDRPVAHLNVAEVAPGDVVIGSLPANLAAAVCEKGARYLHLSLELSPELRGKELTAAEMAACGARIEEYRVERIA